MFLECFPLITKFTCSKLNTILFYFACSNHSNFKNGQSLLFSMSFFLPNVHHSFLILEIILTFMIRREKGLELMNFFFITNLRTFGSKAFLTLKIMDFENVFF